MLFTEGNLLQKLVRVNLLTKPLNSSNPMLQKPGLGMLVPYLLAPCLCLQLTTAWLSLPRTPLPQLAVSLLPQQPHPVHQPAGHPSMSGECA